MTVPSAMAVARWAEHSAGLGSGRPTQAVFTALVAAGALLGGCQAQAALTHWPVPAPPAVTAAVPVLWVALADHLGPRDGAGSAAPLLLQAAGGSLQLLDGRGQSFSGSSLRLRWRFEPLQPAVPIARTVLGPFASYEAAEAAADLWRRQGVTPDIAHPGDWEVWGPAQVAIPAGLSGRRVQSLERRRLTLAVEGPRGLVPLQGPLRVHAPGGLRWQGAVYAGPFRLQANAYGGWSLVELVPLERYLQGVVPHEIGAGAPPVALAAQAVLARTWALRNQGRFRVDGYHLCADTQCQVYGDPRAAGPAVKAAIAATRGQVLSWLQEPIHAVYHASNGGVAAGFEEAWGGSPLPYLRPRVDGPAGFVATYPLPLGGSSLAELVRRADGGYGADHPLYRWQRLLDRAQLERSLGAAAPRLGPLQRVQVLQRGQSGRVLALALKGRDGEVVLRRDAIRRTLRALPSTLFTVSAAGPGVWRFSGGGFGHGAGLSQAGAMDLARRGWGLQTILSHYYPGTTLTSLNGLKPAP